MTKNTNISPYFNDFDEFKNYHQILFKPGFPVQARELTQIQSILQNQVTKLGDHIFQQGSIVIPGNSRGELTVPYAKVEDTYNGNALDLALFDGQTVVGATSGVKAIVKKTIAKDSTDPITLYFSYISGGVVSGVSNGKIAFDLGENIYVESNPTLVATIMSDEGSVGLGSMAFVNTGVYYVNGTFVSVAAQSIVISKYDSLPSCKVLLRIDESFVDYTTDDTLLDPAQGSYNFAAPGADRYKIELVLTKLAYDAAVSNDYVEIMRYNAGVLEEHAMYPKYNELEKSLARRTYDESGDYVVSGLSGTVREAKKVSVNGGLYVNESLDNYAISVSPGKAYIGGFEVEKLASVNLIQPKARTNDHVKTKVMNARPEYGRYILVSHVMGAPSISTRQVISLTNGSSSSTVIGSARVLGIDYHIGDATLNTGIYKLWVTEVSFTNTSYSMVNVGGIKYGTSTAYVIQELVTPLAGGSYEVDDVITTSGTRTATVRYWDPTTSSLYVHKHDSSKETPISGDQIIATGATSIVKSKQAYFGTAQNNAIFQLPAAPVKALKNASNNFDAVAYVQKQITVATNGSGAGSVTIGDGSFVTPEVGNFAAFYSGGVVSPSHFSLSGANNVLNISGGPVNTTVTVFATVIKTGAMPKLKTLTSHIETITVGSGQTVAQLAKADVYRIKSVTIGGNNVTSKYVLNNGQTDYAYYRSRIKLASGQTLPVGNMTVQYEYFQHTSGDYFSVDSYSGNSGYLDYVLNYRSSSGVIYNLLNSIDCRPTVGNSGTDFGTGAIVGDMLVNKEIFTSSIQYFVPRYDALTIDKNGKTVVINGTPAETPSVPSAPTGSILLETFFVPAYTFSVNQIRKTRNLVDRYTMNGIAKIEKRVSNLEKFSTLSAAESSAINTEILDAATGLNRFKTGYMVESFDTPFSMANITSDQFHASFDRKIMMPAIERMECPATLLNTSSNYVNVGGLLMLPYSEVTFAQQPLSSRVTNLNPFLIISWAGYASCVPNSDTWIDVIDNPTIFHNVQDPDINLINWIPSPSNSPAIPNGNIPAANPSSGSNFIGDFVGGALGAAVSVATGVVEAVGSAVGGVVEAVGDVVSDVVDAITSCCVVATALTQQGDWEHGQVAELTDWATNNMDTSFLGERVHRGYHVIAPKIMIPMLKRGGMSGKYIKYTFENGVKLLQGKNPPLMSIPNSVLWISAFMISGLLVTKSYARKSWKNLYRKTPRK